MCYLDTMGVPPFHKTHHHVGMGVAAAVVDVAGVDDVTVGRRDDYHCDYHDSDDDDDDDDVEKQELGGS